MEGKVISIKAGDVRMMVKQYLVLLTPLHKLSPKEVELLTEVIYEYLVRRGDFAREDDCWEKVFHYTTKREIKDRLMMEDQTLQNRLTQLRRKKAITKNRVRKDLIPDIGSRTSNASEVFNMTFRFIYRWE